MSIAIGSSKNLLVVDGKKEFLTVDAAQKAAQKHAGSEKIIKLEDGKFGLVANEPTSAEVKKTTTAMAQKTATKDFEPTSGLFDSAKKMYNSASSIVSSKIDQLEHTVTAEVQDLKKSVSSSVSSLEASVSTQTKAIKQAVVSGTKQLNHAVTAGVTKLEHAVVTEAQHVKKVVSAKATQLEHTVETQAKAIKQAVSKEADHIQHAVAQRVDKLQKTVTKEVNDITATVTKKVQHLEKAVFTAAGEIKDTVATGVDKAGKFVSKEVKDIKEAVVAAADKVEKFVKEEASDLKKVVVAGADKVAEFVKEEASDLKKVVVAGADKVVEFASDNYSALESSAKSVLGIKQDLPVSKDFTFSSTSIGLGSRKQSVFSFDLSLGSGFQSAGFLDKGLNSDFGLNTNTFLGKSSNSGKFLDISFLKNPFSSFFSSGKSDFSEKSSSFSFFGNSSQKDNSFSSLSGFLSESDSEMYSKLKNPVSRVFFMAGVQNTEKLAEMDSIQNERATDAAEQAQEDSKNQAKEEASLSAADNFGTEDQTQGGSLDSINSADMSASKNADGDLETVIGGNVVNPANLLSRLRKIVTDLDKELSGLKKEVEKKAAPDKQNYKVKRDFNQLLKMLDQNRDMISEPLKENLKELALALPDESKIRSLKKVAEHKKIQKEENAKAVLDQINQLEEMKIMLNKLGITGKA